MEKTITYKKQGDGRDSWRIDEYEDSVLTNSYMVYEDPNQNTLSLTDEQVTQLYQKFKELGLIP